MKDLTPLEKEFWKINNVTDWNVKLSESQSWQQEIEKVREIASLCEKKIKRAIELAREDRVVKYVPYSTEEILELLNQNK